MKEKRSVQVAIRESVAASFVCVLAVAGAIASCQPQPQSQPLTPAVAAQPVTSAPAVSASVTAPSASPPIVPAADVQPVTRVVDGDTFVTPEGKVRVLVMDSCESGTQGGALATSDAHMLLDGQSVTLTAEPGHDKDRSGRLLRYVTLPDGRDYADYMLGFSHSAVYAGKNDASPAKVAEGRAADVDGRTCDPAPEPSTEPDSSSSDGPDIDHHDTNHRDGALTGGFCRRHWWC